MSEKQEHLVEHTGGANLYLRNVALAARLLGNRIIFAAALLALAIAIPILVLYATGYRIVDAGGEASSRCLAPVEAWSPAQRIHALDLAEEALAEGGSGPEAGSCEAQRLEWLRSVAR